MKRILPILIFLFLLPLLTNAQSGTKGKSISAADATKLLVVKQKYLGGDFVAALTGFRELELANPDNSTIKYYVGMCFFNMGDKKSARQLFEKAVAVNNDVHPDTYLMLCKMELSDENPAAAKLFIDSFKKSGVTDKELLKEASLLEAYCNNAERLINAPLPVRLISLGELVNSKFDDKNPCVTADGHKLYFTTRRPESENAEKDTEGDGLYFEAIYISETDSMGTQGNAHNAGGGINTKGHDACTSVSGDGKSMIVYRNDPYDRATTGGNLFQSKIMNGKWKKPEGFPKQINSTYWEGGGCISADGKKLFFCSERPGGAGRSDIWVVEKIDKHNWGTPVNAGTVINTPYDEAGLYLAPDGKTLFFCSNGPNSMGGYDVFKTVYEKGTFSTPVNIGYPINSCAREGQISLTADSRYLYFSSDRKNGIGENDVYKVDMLDYAILEPDGVRKKADYGILKGTVREGFEGYGMGGVEITIKDESGHEVRTTQTGERGEYYLTLPAGKYNITVHFKGYKDVTENFDIIVGEKQPLTVEKGFLLSK